LPCLLTSSWCRSWRAAREGHHDALADRERISSCSARRVAKAEVLPQPPGALTTWRRQQASGELTEPALGLVVVARQARHDHRPIGAALIGIPADGQNWRLWRLRRLCSVHGRRDCEASGSGRRGWARARNRLARSAGGCARARRARAWQAEHLSPSTAVPKLNLRSSFVVGQTSLLGQE